MYLLYSSHMLTGGVSLTLRLRLECKIRTMDTVSTVESIDDTCPVSPNEKPLQFVSHFDLPNKASWKREDETHKEMLVCRIMVVVRTCSSINLFCACAELWGF